ncbi:MAG: hypothetical protein MI754_04030, partial [Chromatiales bacterium]|nr:hypothetical protein [Chromatiales bacterium]
MRWLLLSVVLLATSNGVGRAASGLLDEYSSDELLKLGERIFRQGIGANGKPVQALIGKDIPVSGDMFTCVNCHQRSGIGSVEGSVIAWPVNGKELYAPRRRTGAWRAGSSRQHEEAIMQRRELPKAFQVEHARPAYTDETLAKLLRTGVDPAGRSLG